MTISICIPIHNRDRETLEYLISQWFAAGADEIAIGNTGSAPLKLPESLGPIYEIHVPDIVWRPGVARNFAAMASSCDVIVETGSDILIHNSDLFHLNDIPKDAVEICKYCIRLTAKETPAVLAGYTDIPIDGREWKAPGAIMAMRRATFFDVVRGYDNEMVRRGWQDVDLLNRATLRCGMRKRRGDIKTFHLYHIVGKPNRKNLVLSRIRHRDKWWRYPPLSKVAK